MLTKFEDLLAVDPGRERSRRAAKDTQRRPAAGRGGWLRVPCWALVVLASAAAIGAQDKPPIAVLPLYDGGTESFYQLNLGNGDGLLADRLRLSDPTAVRVRVMAQNLYSEIGRPTDQAGFSGEILLGPILDGTGDTQAMMFVETSTGYLAFFDDVGRNGQLGTISVAIGRPFGPLATMDGNYALLMRRDGNGRTDGAYLYHATTGRAFHYGGLRKLETGSTIASVANLPQLVGRVAAAAVQSSDEETISYLIADGGNGELYFFDLSPRANERVAARKSPLNLSEVFPEAGSLPTPERFVAVPLQASNDRTEQIFFVDVSSGEMALLINVRDRPSVALRKSRGNLYDAVEGQDVSGPRVLAAVPALASSGETVGIWFIDSLSGAMVFVDQPGDPSQTTVRRVRTGG